MIMIDTIDSTVDGMIAAAVIMATTVFMGAVAITPTTVTIAVGTKKENPK
jgi:hypothetical protein